MMSRSFGDKYGHTCGVISVPEVRIFQNTQASRAVVMGSDGLWEVSTKDEILEIVKKYGNTKDSNSAVHELYDLSIKNWKKKVSIILIPLEPILC